MINEVTEPQILEAEWERQQIDTLFCDLQLGAEILHVQVRTSPEAGSEERAVSLDEARALFLNESATAIQIRYEFSGQTWCDTLICGQPSTRIIRTVLTLPNTSG